MMRRSTANNSFPSPAEDELCDQISLNQWLNANHPSSFLVPVKSVSMVDAGILPGDFVVLDRGLTPKSGDIVIVSVDGQWAMNYLQTGKDGQATLWDGDPKHAAVVPSRFMKIVGVVRSAVRRYR